MNEEAEVRLVARHPPTAEYPDEILFTIGDGKLYRWIIDTRWAERGVERFVYDELSALVRFREEWRNPDYAPYKFRLLGIAPSLVTLEERKYIKNRSTTVYLLLRDQSHEALVSISDTLIASGKVPHNTVRRMRMAKDNKALLAALICTRLALLG